MLKRWFHRVVLSRRWLTFLVMGLAFFVFGAGTYNLVMLLKANVAVISDYGWQALMDGAARQFAELVVTGVRASIIQHLNPASKRRRLLSPCA